MEKNGEIKEKRSCKRCGSLFTYIRIKDQELVCRSCGHIEKVEDQK